MKTEGEDLIAEKYYDSDDADTFYQQVWGGEDIHVGIYDDPNEEIVNASHKTVEFMAGKINIINKPYKVLDLGAGYGGSARYLAEKFECEVDCLNISEVQNKKNRLKNKALGLADKVRVHHGNFEKIPFENNSYDCVWSQDSILHSKNKDVVFKEVSRVLKPDGEFIFSDPMQKNALVTPQLTKVFERIHLDSMGHPDLYKKLADENGIFINEYSSMPKSLLFHYTNVLKQLEQKQNELRGRISDEYIQSMKEGLNHWIGASRSDLLEWGVFHFKKP